MSGIAGIISPNHPLPPDDSRIHAMTQTLARRGPDDEGLTLHPHAHLGHRRLAVIDPAGGGQPMHLERDGQRYSIVYNGELYNGDEVRAELQALGFFFRTRSDTELLLCAYAAWGQDCVRRLNGIFAFGVWNDTAQTLFLCRDPLGVKPLYYALRDDTLLFGSEIKALLAHPAVRPVIDRDGVCELFGLGPACSPESGVFKGIRQLPPAHWLQFCADGVTLHEYWTLQSRPHSENQADTQRRVRHLLLDAIQRQLVSDVPIGAFLSGGLDSSIISAVAAQALAERGQKLPTFSIDYRDNAQYMQKSLFIPSTDDEWVDVMVDFLGSRHERVVLENPELVGALSDAVQARDLPGMADIDSSLLLACRAVRRRVTVALSGEGADEVFGGYPWYRREDIASLSTFPWSDSLTERAALLSPALGDVPLVDYVQTRYRQTAEATPPEPDGSIDPMKRLFYLNVKWFMNTLLTRKDRMSMAAGLEARVPFADLRLVEYAFNIPAEYTFYAGREKGLLRKALEGLLPDAVLWRKKSPFPKVFHPQYTALVQQSIRALLQSRDARLPELVDAAALQALIDSGGASFTKPWFGQLMTGPQLIAYLLQVELWMRRYNVAVCL